MLTFAVGVAVGVAAAAAGVALVVRRVFQEEDERAKSCSAARPGFFQSSKLEGE